MSLLTIGTTTSVTSESLDKRVAHACGNHVMEFYTVM